MGLCIDQDSKITNLSIEEVRSNFDSEEYKEKAKTYIKNLMHITDAE